MEKMRTLYETHNRMPNPTTGNQPYCHPWFCQWRSVYRHLRNLRHRGDWLMFPDMPAYLEAVLLILLLILGSGLVDKLS